VEGFHIQLGTVIAHEPARKTVFSAQCREDQ
jgi:hypothetical protein